MSFIRNIKNQKSPESSTITITKNSSTSTQVQVKKSIPRKNPDLIEIVSAKRQLKI